MQEAILTTWAYACIVSRSSCAVKRQNSVRVMSSERVPPGAAWEKTRGQRKNLLRVIIHPPVRKIPKPDAALAALPPWAGLTHIRYVDYRRPSLPSTLTQVFPTADKLRWTHPAFHRPPGCRRVSLHTGGSQAFRQRHQGTSQPLPNQCQIDSSLVQYFLETE